MSSGNEESWWTEQRNRRSQQCRNATCTCHIEGTLEPDLALALAKRNRVALRWTSIDELKAQYEFEDLQSFLDL